MKEGSANDTRMEVPRTAGSASPGWVRLEVQLDTGMLGRGRYKAFTMRPLGANRAEIVWVLDNAKEPRHPESTTGG